MSFQSNFKIPLKYGSLNFNHSYNFYDSLVFGIITGIFGQLGDFGESLLKRDVGVKDSGQILRGHGGILDRFDSLLFSAPLVYIYLLLFKY